MNISYGIVLLMYLIIFHIPCSISLVFFYPLYRIFGYEFLMTIPFYLYLAAFRWTDKLFFNVTYHISKEIDLTKRYVYMMNHQSFVDPIVSNRIENFIPVTIVIGYAKFIPFFGQNLWLLGLPFVGKTKTQGITQMYSEYLRNHPNIAFGVFPEGHRKFENNVKLENIRTGGFIIAKNLKQDIVPLYHNMMDRMNDVKKEYYSKPKIFAVCGKPIKVEGREIEDIKKEYHSAMMELRDIIECLKLG